MKGKESFMYYVEICGGYDHLEELQKVPNQRIYEKVIEVLKEYVELEESIMVEGSYQEGKMT